MKIPKDWSKSEQKVKLEMIKNNFEVWKTCTLDYLDYSDIKIAEMWVNCKFCFISIGLTKLLKVEFNNLSNFDALS